MKKANHSFQELAAPEGICFGCGVNNEHGLQIKSHWHEDNIHVIAEYRPKEQHVGWPSLVYGGLISCLIDCHSNWTAMAYHYRTENRQLGTLPSIDCVTGTLGITYLKPTPMGALLTLRAWVEGRVGYKTRVLCEVSADNVVTALGDSIFVRVDIGHLVKTTTQFPG